jgi:hypothetical protein
MKRALVLAFAIASLTGAMYALTTTRSDGADAPTPPMRILAPQAPPLSSQVTVTTAALTAVGLAPPNVTVTTSVLTANGH